MSIPAWPAALPQSPLLSSYEEQLGRGVLRTAMAQGPAKVRRDVSIAPYTINVGMWLTEAQTAIFDTFYNTTLERMYRFSWTNKRTDTSIEARIVVDNGQGPVYSQTDGELYYLSFVMEILP